jgi:gluconolactonase
MKYISFIQLTNSTSMKILKPATLILLMLISSCKPKQNNTNAQILRADQKIDVIVPIDAELEILDTTFQFTEGPVWNPSGYLLFSDIPANKIIKWTPEVGFSTYLEPSENTNGLTFDKDGNLVMAAHSARGIFRQNADGSLTELAHKYQGQKLNSPNDLVISSSGIIYFTDPCWGLNGLEQSADKEVKYNGAYMISDSVLTLIDSTLWRPNGIALSPDQKTLYVTDMFENNTSPVKLLYRYQLDEKGNPVSKEVITVTDPKDEILSATGGFDGIKTDVEGNIYCTGPLGIVILSPEGKYLGTIVTPKSPANCAWGDDDYKTLYITARKDIYRIKLNIVGFSPQRH